MCEEGYVEIPKKHLEMYEERVTNLAIINKRLSDYIKELEEKLKK